MRLNGEECSISPKQICLVFGQPTLLCSSSERCAGCRISLKNESLHRGHATQARVAQAAADAYISHIHTFPKKISRTPYAAQTIAPLKHMITTSAHGSTINTTQVFETQTQSPTKTNVWRLPQPPPACLHVHVDAHSAVTVPARLNYAAVVYLKIIAHRDVLQVCGRLDDQPVLSVEAAAAARNGDGSKVARVR